MKVALLFLIITLPALLAYINNCNTESSPGSCLNPDAGSPACSPPQSCYSPNSQCKQVVTLSNWIASAVTRVCVDPSSSACTPTPSTAANGVETLCSNPPYPSIPSIQGKGPLKCYSCSGSATSACGLFQSAPSTQVGGWTATPVGNTGCWTSVIWVTGTVTHVSRGYINAHTPPPASSYNSATGYGQITTPCHTNLCNNAPGFTFSYPTTPAPPPAPVTTAVPAAVPPGPTTTARWSAVAAECSRAAAVCEKAVPAPCTTAQPLKCDASSITSVPLPVILLFTVLLKITY